MRKWFTCYLTTSQDFFLPITHLLLWHRPPPHAAQKRTHLLLWQWPPPHAAQNQTHLLLWHRPPHAAQKHLLLLLLLLLQPKLVRVLLLVLWWLRGALWCSHSCGSNSSGSCRSSGGGWVAGGRVRVLVSKIIDTGLRMKDIYLCRSPTIVLAVDLKDEKVKRYGIKAPHS